MPILCSFPLADVPAVEPIDAAGSCGAGLVCRGRTSLVLRTPRHSVVQSFVPVVVVAASRRPSFLHKTFALGRPEQKWVVGLAAQRLVHGGCLG